MKRAIKVHRRDFAAVVALIVAAIAVVVYVLEHQPAFTFGKNYYTVKAEFQTGAAVTVGTGPGGDRRRRPGGTDRRRDAAGRPRGRDDEHLHEVQADLPQRDCPAAPADAAEGHVPVARSRDSERGRDSERRVPGRREHAAGREPRPDPLLAGRRHPRLSVAAARRRRAGVPRQRHHRAAPEPGRGSRPARDVQALCAARSRHGHVHEAAQGAHPEHPALDPQLPARRECARRRQRAARLTDSLLEHQLLGDLLAGRKPRGRAYAATADAAADDDHARQGAGVRERVDRRRCSSCFRSRTRSVRRSRPRGRCSCRPLR